MQKDLGRDAKKRWHGVARMGEKADKLEKHLFKKREVVLICKGCCNKLPHIFLWLKTIQMCSLVGREVRSLKSVSLGWRQGVSRPRSFCRLQRRIHFLVSLEVFMTPSSNHSQLLVLIVTSPPSSSVVKSPSASLKEDACDDTGNPLE